GIVQQQRARTNIGAEALETPGHIRSAITLGGIAAILLLVTLLCGVLAVKDYLHAQESADWPSVQGLVSRADHVDVDRKTGKSTPLVGAVSFAYEVNGKKFRAKNIYFGSAQGDDQIRKQYDDGTEVKVYYKPAAPFVAVLHPGITPHAYTGFKGTGIV